MIPDPVLRLWLMGLLVMTVPQFFIQDAVPRSIVWAAGFLVLASASFIEAIKR